MKKSVEFLYHELSEFYEILSRDRDFEAQVGFILQEAGFEPNYELNILEVFSGPAYHGAELLKKGYEVLMVDASARMKEVAIRKRGLERLIDCNYVVGSVPSIFKQFEGRKHFDIVLNLRYSIGYLSLEELYDYFAKVIGCLRRGSKIYFELHSLPSIINDLSDLEIRERTLDYNGTRVTCVWPAGKIKWDESDWIAEMDIEVRLADARGWEQIHVMTSKERIYSTREIAAVANRFGKFEARVVRGTRKEQVFPGCSLLELTVG